MRARQTLGDQRRARVTKGNACDIALQVLLWYIERHLRCTRVLLAFSGGKGYHCWVADDRAMRLSLAERRAIVHELSPRLADMQRPAVLRTLRFAATKDFKRLVADHMRHWAAPATPLLTSAVVANAERRLNIVKRLAKIQP